jgi:hypothetical protein
MVQPLRHYHDVLSKRFAVTMCGLQIRPEGKDEDVIEVAPFWQGVTCPACCEHMEHDIESNAHRAECRVCRADWKKRENPKP